MREIARGAEAILWLDGKELVKERISKGYRIPALDQRLRKTRTKAESNALGRARLAGANVPGVKALGKFKITMDFINGLRVKDHFNKLPKAEKKEVCMEIGKSIAKLHATHLVHGDLTTSNMIWDRGKLFLIDFGLAKNSKRPEDQASDLFLLYEALKAAHFQFLAQAWAWILENYQWEGRKPTLAQLEKIRKRRRYK